MESSLYGVPMLWSLYAMESSCYEVPRLHSLESYSRKLSLSGVFTLRSFHSLESLLPWNRHSCESSLYSLHVMKSSRYGVFIL